MSAPPPGGGWPSGAPPPSAPSIDYWKQLQYRQLQQQQLQYHQQQAAWAEPRAAAAAVSAAAGDGSNYVTTVMVGGLPTPGSPRRCESVRSDAAESSCSSLSQESLSPPARLAGVHSVTAPEGWNRVTSNGLVVYVSPSGVSLTSREEARQYLRAAGTCKCGLECPILVEKSFNFDPKVITRPRSGAVGAVPPGGAVSPSETTKTCNHRRKRAELQLRRATGKDVPPTFQEQRCNPHNNPFFRDQMLQAMEQMGYHQQQQQQQQAYQQSQQLYHPGQQSYQPQYQPSPVATPAGPRWPAVTTGRLPAPAAPPPHLLRAHWDELRRRRAAGRGRRRASPCPNVEVRQLPGAGGDSPSFMDDPSGYLAHQTQLLNDTMQEGLSPVPAEVPIPSTVPLPARVGKHAPPETPAPAESPGTAPDRAPAPDCTAGDPSPAAADSAEQGTQPTEQPADSAESQSPAPESDAAPQPAESAESSRSESLSTPAESEAERTGEAVVSSAGDTQTRAEAAPASTSAPGPVATQAQQTVVSGDAEVPLMQSLPAGQILLPSGQLILTQPFQPMLQYVNAFQMQPPLVVSAGGALLRPQQAEPTDQTPAGRRRRRRQTAGGPVAPQRSQQQQQQAGGQLLQVVSVLGDQCQSSLSAPPPPPPPTAEHQTRMAADSSTSDRGSPDGGGGGGGPGSSPGPRDEPVSSTGEPADEPPRPAKRPRQTAEDDECDPPFSSGDLVWGSHHGLCSWPGQVIERTDVQACDPSQVWVQWFGDHTMSLEAVDQLRRLHGQGAGKRNKSPAGNSSFEEALKEALAAVERQRK
ncbi:methyl-CpG-binding domain protein 6-like [Amphibalanus amphitrite]|uniref:methyl-CpG-binding domain protein 6-like n=1 Tax=Amphibalanus amphitrite TaxID=1232801 RepID=UPI001C904BEF|nr:methyl-CpG-binding domain protein 6-like [Amphibalanus amphitrite]